MAIAIAEAGKSKRKVSVIVPVYNVEKYLRKCLESLVNQTMQDIEIIVVNDGSPDNSQAIIDEYVEKYPQKVFGYIKENGGLGDARNYGIEKAHGEYIGFVDSDDWVDEKMYESMYEYAVKEKHDIVICDFVEINDGWKEGHVAHGYRGVNTGYEITKYEYILNSLDPATACNKLYKRHLFYVINFPMHWYEDMATTPILLSYCNSIGYLPLALYFYRQVQGSITKAIIDKRNLQIIDSWKRCLEYVKKEFCEPMEAAVYKSILVFIRWRPCYAQNYIDFAKAHEERFNQNRVIASWITHDDTENIFAMKLIPRKIHYFWFGNSPKSELINNCIASWKRNAPDFEIIEWNESNCNIHVNRYVEEAYQAQKWAFVADYFRMEKIAEHGGLYFDTDVELMQEPSILLINPAFFAFETKSAVNACVFGAIPHHPVVEQCRRSYFKSSFYNKDGTMNTTYTIVKRITEQLMRYGLEFNGKEQVLHNGVRIYPPNKLTLNMFDGASITQHHYDCSWWDVKAGVENYKHTVLRDYFCTTNGYEDQEVVRQRDYYRSECERLENTTCWKITKPIRIVGDFVKKIAKKGGI